MNFYDNKKETYINCLFLYTFTYFFLSFYKFFTELTVIIIRHLASHNVV